MTENWLAGFANYESWIGDSENEGSPDLDRVFADAHDFQMARAAEAAQVSASNPPAPRPDPAITSPEDAPTPERAPTVPEPNENALTASLSSVAVRVSRHADRYSMPVPRSRYSDMRCPIQQARACMRHDLCDDGTTRTDTRPPSPPNANNNNFEIETHPRQPGDANDWEGRTPGLRVMQPMPRKLQDENARKTLMMLRPKSEYMLKTITRAWWQQTL